MQQGIDGAVGITVDQCGGALQALFQCGVITQRPVDPAAQQAAAHRGRRVVQYTDQAVLWIAGGGLFQFEVAPGGRIQHQAVVAVFDRQAANMRQGSALGIAHVLQQTAGRTNGRRQCLTAITGQVTGAELRIQLTRCAVGLKQPGRLPVQAGVRLQFGWQGDGLIDDDLRRCQALDLTQQGFAAADLLHTEATAREVQCRQSPGLAQLVQCQQQVVLAVIEQRLFGQCPGGDDPHHLALDRSLAGADITDLLANGDRFSLAHQPAQVLVNGMDRHAGHGDGLAVTLAA